MRLTKCNGFTDVSLLLSLNSNLEVVRLAHSARRRYIYLEWQPAARIEVANARVALSSLLRVQSCSKTTLA